MLKYHQGLLMAQAVLNYIDLMDRETLYHIEAYQNCREQGYMIINKDYNLDKVAYVSRNRNSDELIVYIGGYCNRGVSEEAYINAICFNPNNAYEAAEYIIKNIN